VPDYLAFPEARLTVRQEQTLRASVTVGGLPPGAAGGQALLAAGARVPGHGFVPLGLTNVRAAMGSTTLTRTMKMAPRYGGLEVGDCAVAAFAFGGGGQFSLRTTAAERLDAAVDLGSFLAFPSGSTYAPGSRALSVRGVTGADVQVALLQGASGRWRVWTAGGASASVTVPAVPAGMPERATAGAAFEAIAVGAALKAAAGADPVATLADPSTQGFARLAQEAVGLSRGALPAP
jgi:hypothetical protein